MTTEERTKSITRASSTNYLVAGIIGLLVLVVMGFPIFLSPKENTVSPEKEPLSSQEESVIVRH